MRRCPRHNWKAHASSGPRSEGFANDRRLGVTQAIEIWCPLPDSNRHLPFGSSDFKSDASTNSAKRARARKLTRGQRSGQQKSSTVREAGREVDF
jgi:hypothetical protein